MPKHCIVKGCKSDDANGFPFPIDRPAINTKWVSAIEKHQNVTPNYVLKLVCPAHFVETDFLKSRGKAKHISKKAIPSVFPQVQEGDVSDEEDIPIAEQPVIIKEELEDIDEISSVPGQSVGTNHTEEDEDEELMGGEEDDDEYDPNEDESEEEGISDVDASKIGITYDDMEDNSHDQVRVSSQNSESNAESSRTIDTAHIFEDIKSDAEIDSDYEPVTETTLQTLQEKINKKTDTLEKDRKTLAAMEEMIKNQGRTIIKLEEELQALLKEEEEESKAANGSTEKTIPASTQRPMPPNHLTAKTSDYPNKDLQMFAISLYYFSPKVYAYLSSIMPYLPPKRIVVDWVMSGHVMSIFPPGVLSMDKFDVE